MCPSSIDDNFCNAYFVVQATHDEERANMSLESKEVSFILASCSKLKITGHEHVVQIPTFVNTSIIKKGEELLWFVEKEVTESKPQENKDLQMKAAKRAEVA